MQRMKEVTLSCGCVVGFGIEEGMKKYKFLKCDTHSDKRYLPKAWPETGWHHILAEAIVEMSPCSE